MTSYHAVPGLVGRCARSALGVGLVLAVGCGSGSASDAADSTAAADTVTAPSSLTLPVVGEEVRKGDLVLTVSTTGQIRSEAVVPLKVEAAGTVIEILARPGERLRQGQPVVRLDPRPFDIAVAEAEAALRQAQLQLLDNTLPDSLVSGKSVTGERLRNAEVRSGVETARVRLERARYERERAVIAAPFQSLASVPRLRNSTDRMLGSETPIRQATIHTHVWSRTTCRTQRRQRGSVFSFTSKTAPTWDSVTP